MIWRFAAAVVALLPWGALGVPGGLLGWLVGSVLRIRRRHAAASMRRVGIENTGEHLRLMYRSLGTLVFELLWTAGRPSHQAIGFFERDEEQWKRVEAALSLGKGLVVATAHTGNWDLLACAMASRVPLMVVTRHLSWRSLDRFWQRMRADRGVVLVDPQGAVQRASAHLRQGGVVAFLIDQRPLRERGTIEAPFLGASARHELVFADIAARCRAPVAVALAQRAPRGRHRLAVPAIFEPPERPSRAWVKQITLEASAQLDALVRRAPGQWLWLHRRWGAESTTEER